jgi:hypothetical protein
MLTSWSSDDAAPAGVTGKDAALAVMLPAVSIASPAAAARIRICFSPGVEQSRRQ